MCLGVPGRIEVLDPAAASAVVDVDGARRSVCTLLLGDTLRVGDWVLVHVGFAMALIDEQEAAATLDLLASAIASGHGALERSPGDDDGSADGVTGP